MTDGFWGNLKQFLTERPVKVHGDVRSPLMPENYGDGFKENLKAVLKGGPVPKGASNSRLEVAWGAGFGGFGDRIKELFFPVKQAPAQWTSKPVKVKDIWSKDENFGWTQTISIGLHVGIITLLVVPLFTHILPELGTSEKQIRFYTVGYFALYSQVAGRNEEGWRRWWRRRPIHYAAYEGPGSEIRVYAIYAA